MNFKPLLAAKADLDKVDWSNVWASPKLDGIRAIVIDGRVVSRKLLAIPNQHVQDLFGRPEYEGLDGELIVGLPNSSTVYTDTYSGVMKKTGKPDVRYYVFDKITVPDTEYQARRERCYAASRDNDLIFTLPQDTILNQAQLLRYEEDLLNKGYEGVMLRAYHGKNSYYKFGRSTVKEGTLLKLKRFVDAEALVIGMEEEMRNDNVATVDELGHTKRSSHQENKTGKGRLGALVCLGANGVRFRIGTGMDAATREDLWNRKNEIVGKMYARYKYFSIGVVEAPRFPVYLGLRSPIDI